MATRNGNVWTGVAVVMTVAALVGGGVLYFRHQQASAQCPLCVRPIHANNRTVIEVDGARKQVCCPACALSLKAQKGSALRFLSVADFDTNETLVAERATYVIGSDVRTCLKHASPPIDESKRALALHLDRCEPNILAFRTHDRAVAFAGEHGGTLAAFSELGVR